MYSCMYSCMHTFIHACWLRFAWVLRRRAFHSCNGSNLARTAAEPTGQYCPQSTAQPPNIHTYPYMHTLHTEMHAGAVCVGVAVPSVVPSQTQPQLHRTHNMAQPAARVFYTYTYIHTRFLHMHTYTTYIHTGCGSCRRSGAERGADRRGRRPRLARALGGATRAALPGIRAVLQ